MREPLQAIHDEWLVLRSQAGEAAALNELARRWHPPLWRFARRKIGRDDGAADAMQDAWLAMARGLRRLHDPAAFRRWAYRVVSRSCANWIRREQRRRRLKEHIRNDAGAAASPHHPARTAETDDDIAALRDAIDQLPAPMRDSLELHYLDGLSVAEISTVLGVPRGTVKSRLFHARRELRAAMERSSQ